MGEQVSAGIRRFLEKRFILRAEPCTNDHQQKSDEIRNGWHFAEYEKREKRSDERCYRIIRARSGGTQNSLRVDVEKDAESIRDKADGKDRKHTPKGGQAFSKTKPDDNGACSRENTLEQNDFQRVFGGKLSRAVVFNAPTDTSQQNKKRADGKAERGDILKGKKRTGCGHKEDPDPKTRADGFLEDDERDDGGRHDFKIIEQRSVCRRGEAQSQKKKDGGGNIQKDHGKRIGQV